MPVTYLPAYTQNKTISLPEVRLREPKPTYVYVPLRGYGALLAVYDTTEDKYVGWIGSEDLGYPTAKGTNIMTKKPQELVDEVKRADQGALLR